MEKLTLEIKEDTEHMNDQNTYRMHFYESSVTTPSGERLLTICNRGGGMRATEGQVRELHAWLGEWLNG